MQDRFYFSNREGVNRYINSWDILLLILILGLLFFFAWAGQQMARPYALGQPMPIYLDIHHLPFYALRTVLRMFIALFISIIFTFTVGSLAAKNRRAEQLIVPAIDILQSVPVLSFLAISVTGFIQLFPGSLLGPEFASIFVIFTSQVWNMVFSFYQSLRSFPHDLKEVAAMFQLSSWQCFWKLEVPFSMPGLLWNMMMSMSASWFFVVLSEAIAVANQDIRLPGIGSYIALAIQQGNWLALAHAIVAMILVIFLYDQILFRPLIAWSEKFKMEQGAQEEAYQSWLIDWMRESRLMKRIAASLSLIFQRLANASCFGAIRTKVQDQSDSPKESALDWLWPAVLIGLGLFGGYGLLRYMREALNAAEIAKVCFLGAATATRVIILIILSSLLWIPLGVFVGLRPRIAQRLQPIIQFLAAFPANLFYPLFVIAIVRYHLNVEIWVSPLMILGTQWYILFNVIAGASAIPRDLCMAADNFGLKSWRWWQRLALPAIFPYYITGAITAAGGAWNASIVAEWVSWGNTHLIATGLGAYIQESTMAGQFSQIALGTGMMCLYVLLFNHFLWRPLYRMAQARFNYY